MGYDKIPMVLHGGPGRIPWRYQSARHWRHHPWQKQAVGPSGWQNYLKSKSKRRKSLSRNICWFPSPGFQCFVVFPALSGLPCRYRGIYWYHPYLRPNLSLRVDAYGFGRIRCKGKQGIRGKFPGRLARYLSMVLPGKSRGHFPGGCKRCYDFLLRIGKTGGRQLSVWLGTVLTNRGKCRKTDYFKGTRHLPAPANGRPDCGMGIRRPAYAGNRRRFRTAVWRPGGQNLLYLYPLW